MASVRCIASTRIASCEGIVSAISRYSVVRVLKQVGSVEESRISEKASELDHEVVRDGDAGELHRVRSSHERVFVSRWCVKRAPSLTRMALRPTSVDRDEHEAAHLRLKKIAQVVGNGLHGESEVVVVLVFCDGENAIALTVVPENIAFLQRLRRVQKLLIPVRELNDEGSHRVVAAYRRSSSPQCPCCERERSRPAFANDERSCRVDLDARYDPDLTPMRDEVADLRQARHVLDLRVEAEAKGRTLLFSHPAWKSPT
jgi:hypothetical protein